ncbi:MAG: hypothetical protein CME62_13585 [Halobacteriovoraceae bacterium]|nr:hypothetical protein [Halobacteriovoraceae bacterium]|tara:strand:- start:3231 stop:4421 length:1191 start_codon:yes stop_codon:yes gene_type:complete
MNLEERFINCRDFLKKWQSFLEREPIRKYPNFCPTQIRPWVEELMQKDTTELVTFENEFKLNTKIPEFSELLATIRDLIDFPQLSFQSPSLISNKIKEKKAHEIAQISFLLNEYDQLNLIDIGGGAGHLSENLIHKRDRFSFCIDQDSNLHESGRKRILRNHSQNQNKIEFVPLRFNEKAPVFRNNIYLKNLVLGLHACGDLSADIIHYFQKSQADHLLSVGCCYHKLTSKYNLSKRAQKDGLHLSTNAFNLAARSYAYQTSEQLELKIKVREYRYMLHCYLYFLGHREFIPTGQTKLKDYEMSFSKYAQKYAGDLIPSLEKTQKYYNQKNNQEMVSEIIYTDILRGLFGRVIEAYIILDRALFLQELGHKLEVLEIFDRKLSPRNLAIYASSSPS